MKLFAVLVASLAVLVGGTLSTAAHSTVRGQAQHASIGSVLREARSWRVLQLLSRAHSLQQPGVMPLQAAGTGTPTATPGVTPTATTSPYPDAATLLQQSITIAAKKHSAHFTEAESVADASTQASIGHSNATGDANCTSYKAKVTAAVNLGAGQSSSASVQVVVIKKNGWIKGKSTKNVWKKSSKTTIENNYPVGDPLACSSSSTGSGSSNTIQVKDITNLGPDTISGKSVWHIQATILDTSSNLTITIDLYVGQTDYLPYKEIDSAQEQISNTNVNVANTTLLSKFNEKLTITKPKVGSA